MMVYSYGSQRIGKWITLTESNVATTSEAKDTGIYEATYIVPRKALEDYQSWLTNFDTESFNFEFARQVAEAVGILPEDIEVLWWEFNNVASPPYLRIQIRYVPKEIEANVGFIGWVAVFAGIGLTTYITSVFALTGESKLDKLKYLLEQGNIALMYGLYLILAGGGIYFLARFLPKWLKKRK